MTKTSTMRWGNHTSADLSTNYLALKRGVFCHHGVITYNSTRPRSNHVPYDTNDPNIFDPGSTFNPTQWVTAAKAGGFNYIVYTAMHQDGWTNWPSSVSPHGVHQSSWYAGVNGVDPFGVLADACRAGGVALIVYFSIWNERFETDHPGYTQADYLAYQNALITELNVRYGNKIDGFWFDGGYWHDFGSGASTYFPNADSTGRYLFVKGLWPNAIVIENDHRFFAGLIGVDVKEFEINNGTTGPAGGNILPAESCFTLRSDGEWYYRNTAYTLPAASDIAAQISGYAANNSNSLVGVGPNTSGLFPADHVTLLAQIGALL